MGLFSAKAEGHGGIAAVVMRESGPNSGLNQYRMEYIMAKKTKETTKEMFGLWIRHPLSQAWHDMDSDQFAGFAHDIEVNGQREKVVMYQGEVLDGWHRVKALVPLNRAVRTVEYTGDDPMGYAISANAMRRHLGNAGQRIMAVLACVAWRAPGSKGDKGKGLTVEQVASLSGASERQVQRAKAILQMDGEAAERVRTGEGSLNEEYTRLHPAHAQGVIAQMETPPESTPEPAVSELAAMNDAGSLINASSITAFERTVDNLPAPAPTRTVSESLPANPTTCAQEGCGVVLDSNKAEWRNGESYCSRCDAALGFTEEEPNPSEIVECANCAVLQERIEDLECETRALRAELFQARERIENLESK